MIRYDTRCYFSVRSKADMSQHNLPHGTNKPKSVKKRKKLKSKKTDMLRSIGKHSRESVESVRPKKRKGCGGKDLQKRKVLLHATERRCLRFHRVRLQPVNRK